MAGLGAISGAVRDFSGAAVPGAKVRVENSERGLSRNLETTEAGLFNAVSLPPAKGYTVTITKDGFAAFEFSKIEILVGQIVNLRAELQVAATQTRVDVSGQGVLIDPGKTGVSDVVTSRQILDLPINGRRVDSFVLLTPGVSNEGQFGLLTFRGIPGGNTFLTDGNDTTNQLWGENAGRTRIAANISQDAVQEFQVLSNNYSAEFGRAVGGVVNTVTRSGGNGTNGTAYWFFRNQDFNARDGYSAVNPDEVRHQAGASIGGPIVRDRLFYFANVDFTRRDFPIVSSHTSPPLFNAQGNFVGQCELPATPGQCQTAADSLNRFRRTINRTANNDLGFGKIDWRPSDAHSFSFSFNVLNWESPNGIQTGASLITGAGVGNNGYSSVKTRFARGAWTAIVTPNLVNEFRFGWFKDKLFDDVSQELIPPTGVPTISVQGVANLGSPNYLPRLFPDEDRFQFTDTLSWTTGRHLFKAGFDFSHVNDLQDQVFGGNGAYSYANFSNFAADFSGNNTGAKRWQSYSQGFGPSVVETWIRDYIFFAQDQYRLSDRLTLNYGFRYEYAQFKQPDVFNADYPQTRRIPQPATNIAPRLGFAYSLGERTVIRGGYGIFYARIPGGQVNFLHRDNSNFQYTIFLQGQNAGDVQIGPVFPQVLPNTDRRPPPGSTSLSFAGDNWRTPYTQQADLGVERQIGRNMSVTVSYIWSRGIAFTTIRDANAGALGEPRSYRINDASGNQTGTYSTPVYLTANRVDPRYQRVGVLESNSNTYYNAMAVQFRKRTSRWWEGSVAYTWSHAIDYNQGVTGDNLFFGSTPRTLFNDDFRGERGTSEIDQRHRFVFNSIFDLKFTRSGNWFVRKVVDNWQLSQITTLASGNYATGTIFVSGTPFPGAAFNTSLNGFGGSTRVPFAGRSGIPIDLIRRVDARLSKVFDVSERLRVQFLLEAFNVTNSQYNTSVRTQAYQAANGVLTPTPRLGEGTQASGFPDGTNARRAQVGLRLVF